MSSIKQTIPSFVQGMTDQPDVLKIPGQVRSVSNALPDVTIGLMKRPGLQHLSTLADTDPDGKWLNIFAENTKGFEEQYISNVTRDGVVRVWAATDIKNEFGNVIAKAGDPIKISQPSATPLLLDDNGFRKALGLPRFGDEYATEEIEYFKHTRKAQLQDLNIGATTLVANRDYTPTMSGKAISIEQNPYEAFIEIKQVEYARNYTIDILSPSGSDVEVISATNLSISPGSFKRNENQCLGQGTEIYQNLASGSASGLAFRISAICYISPSDSNDSPGDSNYNVTVDLLNGGKGWSVGTQIGVTHKGYYYVVTVTSVGRRLIQGYLGSVNAATPVTGDQIISSNSILDPLVSQLRGVQNANGQLLFKEVTKIGNGIYLKAEEEFTISTPEQDLFNLIYSNTERNQQNEIVSRYSQVNNVGDLPQKCKDGFICKVVNTFQEQDDYYVIFRGNDDTDGGGIWEETVKPGVLTQFNTDTMPHVIRRTLSEDGSLLFEVGEVDWVRRTVGDDQTNPIPSFVAADGSSPSINAMILYRNRLVFLSSNNVILSQSGDLGNWFGETALTVKNSDPIDINASVDTSTALYAGLVVNNGMVLFSKFNQFLFTTDSDVLSPQTAKSSLIGSYDFNPNSQPFNMASNIGFWSTAGNDSIFWEMRDIFREGPVNVQERSKPVQRSLPSDLDIVCASREDGLILTTSKGYSDVWGYRYFIQGDRQLQAAWFKWTMPGEILFHFNNTRGLYWVIYKDGNDAINMIKLDLKDKLRSTSLEGVPYEYYVYLDNWVEPVIGDYDRSSHRTEITLPYTPDRELTAYTLEVGEYRGRSATVEDDGGKYYLPGNWTNHDSIAVGYKFEMEVKFPHLYVTSKEGNSYRSDTTGSLTLHRMKVNFSTVGMFTFELNRYGKDPYIMTTETTEMDGYDADRVAGYTEQQFTIPVYDRSENTLLTMKSDHPTPATLLQMTFEGDYTTNYYKNV